MDFHRFSISMLVWWRLLACFVRRMSCDPSARLNADQCTSGFAAGLTGPCEWTSPNGRNCRWSLQMLSLQKHICSKLDTPEIQITRKWDKLRSNVAPWGSPVLKGKNLCSKMVPNLSRPSCHLLHHGDYLQMQHPCSNLSLRRFVSERSLPIHAYIQHTHTLCISYCYVMCVYIYIRIYRIYIYVELRMHM
jgi:hypothetical protein